MLPDHAGAQQRRQCGLHLFLGDPGSPRRGYRVRSRRRRRDHRDTKNSPLPGRVALAPDLTTSRAKLALRAAAAAVALLLAGAPRLPGQTLVGKRYPNESRLVDNRYGHEVRQWTASGSNNHLYFNIESFVDPNRFLFFSTRSGKADLFLMDLRDGTATQITDETDLRQSVWHLPQSKTLWFIAGRTVKALDTSTLEVRTVHSFAAEVPESLTVTCDGRYLVYAANKNPGYSANHSTGPYALFRLDLRSQQIRQISPDLGFRIGHVQASPTDPTRVIYCWQHVYVKGAAGTVGNVPNRIWWNDLEGTDGGPVGIQEFGLHRTHEFWFPDGRQIGYSARYHFGPNRGRQYIGVVTPDGRDNFMIQEPVSSSHSQVFAGGRHWVCDLHDGLRLILLTIEGRTIVKRDPLFDHQSTMEGQPSHPHPHFSPDGRHVLFSTDRSGTPQVYTVRVDLAPAARP